MIRALHLHSPIGVFDSGVGGLTVLAELRRRLPHRNFIYLGDTARVPYGRKPPEMVVEFARGIADFLCGLGVEGLVVACNTASAVALPQLAATCPVPVWGVIDPGVEAATRVTCSGTVGVIGTKATITSQAYQRRLEERGLRPWAQACPMLVHVVEEGLAESPEVVAAAFAKPGISDNGFVDHGRVVHFVTGDPRAFAHTAGVIGGVGGEIIPLPVTELATATAEA